VVETNLLPRNGPPDLAPDFFISGLVEKHIFRLLPLDGTLEWGCASRGR
jgi:hypothetical protein